MGFLFDALRLFCFWKGHGKQTGYITTMTKPKDMKSWNQSLF